MAMKHISDRAVCIAVDCYQIAMRHPHAPHVPYPYEILSVILEQPEKVCYRAMERAERRGYIEYGVSLRTGWLTQKGRDLIKEPEA